MLFGRTARHEPQTRPRPRRRNARRASPSPTPADQRVSTYSGGMRRRVDIACGLVAPPKVVFLDEPTTGLDPRSRREVWDLVGSLTVQGITVLLTTQYLEEADALSDPIVVIDRGTVIADGSPEALKRKVGGSYCQVTPVNLADVPRDRLRAVGDRRPADRRHRNRRGHRHDVASRRRRSQHVERGVPPCRLSWRRAERYLAAQAVARRGVLQADRRSHPGGEAPV